MATRVLVVDDDPTVSNVVSAYLTKAGYDARVVADLVEVALTQTEEDRAVELRVAADEVLLVGAEGIAVLVNQILDDEVALLEEHLLGFPVLGLAGQNRPPDGVPALAFIDCASCRLKTVPFRRACRRNGFPAARAAAARCSRPNSTRQTRRKSMSRPT